MNTDPIEQLRRLVEARAKATVKPWNKNTLSVNAVEIGEGRATIVHPCHPSDEFDADVIEHHTNDAAFIALAGSLDLQAILSAWHRDREELAAHRRVFVADQQIKELRGKGLVAMLTGKDHYDLDMQARDMEMEKAKAECALTTLTKGQQ